MGLKVIGSGFGRTGTMSTKMALEQLGFGPCHHMIQVMNDPAQPSFWDMLAAGKKADWAKVFADYQSQVDFPGAAFWDKLTIAFPEAKVIHTERPEEDWWASFSATIGKFFALRETIPLPPPVASIFKTMDTLLVRQFLGGLERETCIKAYRRNNEKVRATVRADKLLVFTPSDGWEPICRFLAVPVPKGPFPRSHARDEFWAHFGGEPMAAGQCTFGIGIAQIGACQHLKAAIWTQSSDGRFARSPGIKAKRCERLGCPEPATHDLQVADLERAQFDYLLIEPEWVFIRIGDALMDHSIPNLPSQNFEKTKQFYMLIGFSEDFGNDGWLILRRGSLVLEFFPHPKLKPAKSWFSCCLRFDDLDAFYMDCLKAGANTNTPALKGRDSVDDSIVSLIAQAVESYQSSDTTETLWSVLEPALLDAGYDTTKPSIDFYS